ncbi:hypothetical protein GF389_00300 [Candidatus Dojkabacteria bacterium]|nr:hypothetical protein [Candidatus Dojkabacteria bacterium]
MEITKEITRKNLVKFFPFWFLGIAFFLKIIAWDIYRIQFGEDGIIEYIQFVLYAISGLFLFVTFLQQLGERRYFLVTIFFVLCIGVLFVAMEEISWGQRILGFETPVDLKKKNVQGELTFHNVDLFHRYILHNAYILVAICGLFLIEKPKQIYRKFSKKIVDFVSPAENLKYYFFVVGSFYIFLQYVYPIEERFSGKGNPLVYPGDQEVFELVLAVAVFSYSFSKFGLRKSS